MSTQLAPTGTATLVQGDATDRLQAAMVGFLLGYRNQHTRTAYTTDLRGFLGWCQGHDVDPLTDVTRVHLEAWTRSMDAEGFAPSTVARKLSAVAGFYRYTTEEGWTDQNPAERVRRPQVPGESPTLGLDRDEARALLDVAQDAGPRDLALVSLLLLNGLRVSEACTAQVEDLSVERGHRVLAVTRKRGRREQVPLAATTWDAVAGYLVDRTTGPLLLANDGKPLQPHHAARIVRRLARAAGVTKPISPHSLRHTAVTLALDAGVSLRDVQDMAGHADPRTTRRYDRARRSLDRHATYTLAGYLA